MSGTMDPITTNIIVSSATSVLTEAVRKDAVEFLQKVFKKGWGLAGGLFSERVNEWRRDNAIITLGLAHQRLRDIGVEPAEVAPQILLPLLEAASLQDGEDVRSKWANLLANAADPRERMAVRPKFVAILSQLSPGEAKFYDVLCLPYPVLGKWLTGNQISQAAADAGIARWQTGQVGYPAKPDWDDGRGAIEVALDNCCSNGLIERVEVALPIDARTILNVVQRGRVPSPIQVKTAPEFRLTRLGADFICACRAPVKL